MAPAQLWVCGCVCCLQWMSHIGDVCLLACVTYCTKFMVKERSPCKRCKCASVWKWINSVHWTSPDLSPVRVCGSVCVCVCTFAVTDGQLCQLYCPLSNSWWTRWCPQCILSPWPLATVPDKVCECVYVYGREKIKETNIEASKWI